MSDSLRFRLHWNRLPAVRTIRTRLTFASTSTKLAGTTNSMEHGPKSSKWEVENGQYTRPFDPFEETFSSLCHDRARPEFRSLDAVASIGIETLPNDANAFLETLKKAWARIRYLHPFLASEVGPKAFRYTPLQGQSDIDEWLQKTLIIKDWDSESEVQGCQDLAVAPATQAPRLYYFPGKRRLIIRMNHMHIDGHGLVSMLQDLFAEMHRLHYDGETVNEPWGEEVQNLASSAFDAAGIAALKDPCSLKLPQPRADGEAFEFPSINTTFPPASGKTQSLDFTESQTSEFLCHAKGSGLGITAFVHAALIHAGKAVCPSSRSTVHSNFIIFNFREKCTASPVNAHLKATALRIGFWPIQVHIDDEFRRTAFRVKHEYESLASRFSEAGSEALFTVGLTKDPTKVVPFSS
ncbi:hypothetical protein UA08_04967 [Talaromyces atroroseus]|uniref:Condensation domain-containing protein n=1 Tax=Talaromyces atroroseus TaxID=1441469 RepID=A0A225AZZ6_TALAT|nr:hypothetical protein UA08_04967 [Talaromyces atroroseus]OKL60045.1 hypothetical protein UA08_04967 [Talaromyces atroroseus]